MKNQSFNCSSWHPLGFVIPTKNDQHSCVTAHWDSSCFFINWRCRMRRISCFLVRITFLVEILRHFTWKDQKFLFEFKEDASERWKMSGRWIFYNSVVKCLEIRITVSAVSASQKWLEYTKLPHLLEEVSDSLSNSEVFSITGIFPVIPEICKPGLKLCCW